jgi:hypothetical protein
MTRMCCVCSKVEHEGQWRFRHRPSENERVTHGYCPQCYIKVMEDINRFISDKASRALHAPDWSKLHGSCHQCA